MLPTAPNATPEQGMKRPGGRVVALAWPTVPLMPRTGATPGSGPTIKLHERESLTAEERPRHQDTRTAASWRRRHHRSR